MAWTRTGPGAVAPFVVIVLRSVDLLARLDPGHGGEILDLIDLATGRQLLGRPPFASLPTTDPPLTEDAWTAGYRGGWQLLTPNAGSSCEVGGETHAFHGLASSARWDVLEARSMTATLRWSGHGIRVTRQVSVAGGSLAIETDWLALRDGVGFLAVEHIALGLEVFAPSGTIRLPGGTCFELSETEGPVVAPSGAPVWPDVLRLDGRLERSNALAVEEPDGCFLAVQSLPEGWYEVVNDLTGQGVRVVWDLDVLPHLWLWREIRATGGPWRNQAELLALEPASVPHSVGLARALAQRQGIVLAKGERRRSRISATPFRAVVTARFKARAVTRRRHA
jgi:hypothetical protein